jgi:hypothetical protein
MLALLTLALLLTIWDLISYALHGAWFLPFGIE